MRVNLLRIAGLWALLLAPLLCMSGVLTHACVDCPEQAFCEHEDDCDGDLCAMPIAGNRPQTDQLNAPGPSLSPSDAAICQEDRVSISPEYLESHPGEPRRAIINLPCHAADLPLII